MKREIGSLEVLYGGEEVVLPALPGKKIIKYLAGSRGRFNVSDAFNWDERGNKRTESIEISCYSKNLERKQDDGSARIPIRKIVYGFNSNELELMCLTEHQIFVALQRCRLWLSEKNYSAHGPVIFLYKRNVEEKASFNNLLLVVIGGDGSCLYKVNCKKSDVMVDHLFCDNYIIKPGSTVRIICPTLVSVN